MKKLNILLDMDDVLADFLPHWLETINKSYAYNVKVKDIKSWSISHYYPALSADKLYAPLKNPAFWQCLKPKDGAMEAVKDLYHQGHRITIVTAAHYKTLAMKAEWLLLHFPFLTWENIIAAAKKQMIKGDLLVDDNINNLTGGCYQKLLFDMPHNQSEVLNSEKIFRVKNWREVSLLISKFSEL